MNISINELDISSTRIIPPRSIHWKSTGTADQNWHGTEITSLNTIHADELVLQGKKISDILENIENKLAILTPNAELEEKWEQLRDLRNQYIKLEKEILEKEKMWGKLK